MFQMAAEMHQPSVDEAELTPIFHALAGRAADPVTHFHRDPLAAPLPSTEQARAAVRAVPAPSGPGSHRSVADIRPRVGGATEAGFGGRHTPGRVGRGTAAAYRLPSGAHRALDAEPGEHHSRASSPVEETRGGRHRVLRAVNHPGERLNPGRSVTWAAPER